MKTSKIKLRYDFWYVKCEKEEKERNENEKERMCAAAQMDAAAQAAGGIAGSDPCHGGIGSRGRL